MTPTQQPGLWSSVVQPTLTSSSLSLTPQAEQALRLLVTQFESGLPDRRATANLNLLVTKIVADAFASDTTEVDLMAFTRARDFFCPGLWPYC